MFSIRNIIITIVVLGVGALVAFEQFAPKDTVDEAKTALKEAVKDTVKYAAKEVTKPATDQPAPDQPEMEPTAIPNLYGDDADALVMSQVKAYAAKDLGGMLDAFHPDIQHIDLKNGGTIEGLDVSWKVFGDLFRQVDWVKAEVVQKIVVGDVVIYIEKLEDSADPEVTYSLVVHQVKDGLIRKIWYYNGLPAETTDENNGVAPVNAQLQAYNKGDLAGFMVPYAKNVKLITLGIEGNTDELTGYDELYPVFDNLFKTTKGLHAEIRGRLIHGPLIVDHEYVTLEGRETAGQALAIYRVDKDLIQQVWFIYPSFE